MERKYNRKLLPYSVALRKKMTKEERKLWYLYLSKCRVRFLRQKIIGDYIVDFYCAELKLVIELDGSQHYEETAETYDKERTEYLSRYGIKVIRISNREINRNFNGVCEYIENLLGEHIECDKNSR